MIKKIKSKIWKSDPCPEAIAEADELLEGMVYGLAILLAIMPQIIRWLP